MYVHTILHQYVHKILHKYVHTILHEYVHTILHKQIKYLKYVHTILPKQIKYLKYVHRILHKQIKYLKSGDANGKQHVFGCSLDFVSEIKLYNFVEKKFCILCRRNVERIMQSHMAKLSKSTAVRQK